MSPMLFDLVRAVIGTQTSLSRIPTEWDGLNCIRWRKNSRW